MNINLGSGPKQVENYICIDKSPRLLLSKMPLINFLGKAFKKNYEMSWDSDIKYKDVRKLHFKAQSISNIYSSHLLEHLYLYEAKELLLDCFLFLKPGGVLRLALPDYHEFILQYVSNYEEDPVDSFFVFESSLLSWPLDKQNFLERLNANLFGRLHVHKWHPTPFIVQKFLEEVGFEKITQYEFQVGTIPNLSDIENRDSQTFYIEGTKPLVHDVN